MFLYSCVRKLNRHIFHSVVLFILKHIASAFCIRATVPACAGLRAPRPFFSLEFLMVIAEQSNEILKCAMYLFLGYLDGASQFAQSCGGGGTSSDLPWGRNPDEEDRRFAYRCMMQAYKMLKPTSPKRGIGGKR